MEEEIDIVIVGAGLSGLATALALHRKGIRSVVLERAPELRSEGSAISLHVNGWRVLDRLGVADDIRRRNTVVLTDATDIFHDGAGVHPTKEIFTHEFRFIRRTDLVNALAAPLPPGAVRLNCNVSGIVSDTATPFPTVLLADGGAIKAKVLIGADGCNSAVARFLGLPPAKPFPCWMIRGFTTYPGGHPYGEHFFRFHGRRSAIGRVAVADDLVHFFVAFFPPFDGTDISKEDKVLIKKLCVATAQDGYPEDVVEMMKNCDAESLSLTRLRYRAPWHINPFRCQKGTVTVAGDAMHVMGPFLGQGGASGLEDALVLARLLSEALGPKAGGFGDDRQLAERVEKAQRRYVRERLVRVVGLVLHTVLFCTFLETQSKVRKVASALAMIVLFGGFSNARHILYDCGPL